MHRRALLRVPFVAGMASFWSPCIRAQAGPLATAGPHCTLPDGLLKHAASFLSEINLLRQQPGAYAELLDSSMASLDEQGVFVRAGFRIQTIEGRAAVAEALAALRRQRPLVPVNLSSCLSAAAQGHAQYLGRTGSIGHVGAGGSTPSQRASQAAGARVNCGETVSAGPGTARDHVIALLVDDGIADRGHRLALLDPSYRTLGAGVSTHAIGTVAVQMFCEQRLPA